MFQEYVFRAAPASVSPAAATTSRLRCSGLRLNVRTAAASAASRLGACTSPKELGALRMRDARQERDAAPRGFVWSRIRARGSDGMD
jgi:hypothetical protein